MSPQLKSALIILALFTLRWSSPCLGQASPPGPAVEQHPQEQRPQESRGTNSAPQPGSINGTVVDQSGAVVPGAQIQLASQNQSVSPVVAGSDGQFFFPRIAPGPFQLTISSAGFAAQVVSGILQPGQIDTLPRIVLDVAKNITDVQVTLTQVEVAEEQMKVEEKQRVLGAIPNFYVTYDPHAVSLNAKQKFKLAVKSVIDPFTFVVVAGAAGIEQAQNYFGGYGQGAQGYAKRFGAGTADNVTSTFIGGAILPSILKQDPRYFYKGTGSKRSRFFYAVANTVICKGDNGHWQPNYSGVLGGLAAAAISNLYYPSQETDVHPRFRRFPGHFYRPQSSQTGGVTLDNTAIGLGEGAVTNLLQEFLIRHLTPKIPKYDPSKP